MNRRNFITALATGLALAPGARARAQTLREVDVIVVGAGSSGCVVANRLSADPTLRVLVVEAGVRQTDNAAVTTPGRWVSLLGSPVDWGYATEPEAAMAARRIAFPRGRALGGSSAINAMTYIRGHRSDFERWRRAGNTGWGYDDVLPAFRRVEDNSRGASAFRGAGGALRVADCTDPHAGHHAFLRAAEQHGYRASPTWDFSVPEHEGGAGFVQKNIKDGRRHSAADAFLLPVTSRPNLEVLTGVVVERLTLEQDRVVGLEAIVNGRRQSIRARREVVLCAGVIDSPKLLMLSGIGPADHLRDHGIDARVNLLGVGANLQDHLKLSIRWNGTTALPPSTVTGGLFVLTEAGAKAGLGPGPDLQFYVGRGLDQPDRFVTITVSLVRPLSRGQVRLRSADPLAPAVIVGNYLREPADVAVLVEGAKLARQLGQSSAYAALRGDEIEPGPSVQSDVALAEFARRAADTIYHPAGTCRMGSDREAVVDSRLRVRGVRGLRIADASIMPDVVSATTHAACVMIGERAAEFMRAGE